MPGAWAAVLPVVRLLDRAAPLNRMEPRGTPGPCLSLNMLSSVVLPEPDGPTIASIRPVSTCPDTPLRIVLFSNLGPMVIPSPARHLSRKSPARDSELKDGRTAGGLKAAVAKRGRGSGHWVRLALRSSRAHCRVDRVAVGVDRYVVGALTEAEGPLVKIATVEDLPSQARPRWGRQWAQR